MAMVNCNKCDYAFDESEKFCPRCEALYVKEAYVKKGPVPGLPYAEKPSRASQPADLNLPKFKPTKERYNYGPRPDEVPNVRDTRVSANQQAEYKKNYGGRILVGLIILIILVVIYNVFVK